jgi:CheY-like chemotaxis protein
MQLCRTDHYRTGRIAAFVREGLNHGEDVLIMATAERCAAVEQALRTMTAPFDMAVAAERLMFLDAAAMLDKIVIDGQIDRELFAECVRPFLARSARRKRAYGEMVALLVADGQLDVALALERIGDELAHDGGVHILCGYDHAMSDAALARVIACHDDFHVEAVLERAPAPPLDPSQVTVLLADDYEDTRDLFGEYLQFQGYQVVLAADGVEALNLARQIRPDIVLLDIRMPRMTGTEVMRALKADRTFVGVPIIALTAHALHNERAAMIAEGFDAVVTKPCLPPDLVGVVAALTARQRPDAAL